MSRTHHPECFLDADHAGSCEYMENVLTAPDAAPAPPALDLHALYREWEEIPLNPGEESKEGTFENIAVDFAEFVLSRAARASAQPGPRATSKRMCTCLGRCYKQVGGVLGENWQCCLEVPPEAAQPAEMPRPELGEEFWDSTLDGTITAPPAQAEQPPDTEIGLSSEELARIGSAWFKPCEPEAAAPTLSAREWDEESAKTLAFQVRKFYSGISLRPKEVEELNNICRNALAAYRAGAAKEK